MINKTRLKSTFVSPLRGQVSGAALFAIREVWCDAMRVSEFRVRVSGFGVKVSSVGSCTCPND